MGRADTTVVKKSSYTTSVSSSPPPRRSPGDQRTVSMLLNILLMVFLSVVTMAFVYMYAKHPAMIVAASCSFIALYAMLILYVVNQVSEDDGFDDPVLTEILRWTTMVVIVLSILVAMASLMSGRVASMMKGASSAPSAPSAPKGDSRVDDYIRRSRPPRDGGNNGNNGGNNGGNGGDGRRSGKKSGRKSRR